MATILVSEDEAHIRSALVALLEAQEHQVIATADGRQALDTLERAGTERPPRYPDLIILDLMMPVLDGAAFLDRVQRDQRCRGIPVIVLSAHFRLAKFSRLPGVAAVVEKPFDPPDLLAEVRRLLAGPPA